MSPTFSAVYAFMPKARMPSLRRIGRHSRPSSTGIRSRSSIVSTSYLLTSEHLPVQIVEPSQLLERPLVVVDAQVDERVGEPRIARVALDDEERGRLLAAAVAAGRLGSVETGE